MSCTILYYILSLCLHVLSMGQRPEIKFLYLYRIFITVPLTLN